MIIPKTMVGSFADGKVLQTNFFAVMFGAEKARLGTRGKPVIDGIGSLAVCGKLFVAVNGTCLLFVLVVPDTEI